MRIGNVEITGRAALAPMAGVADRAFRRLCVEHGAAYTVSEMVSSKGLCFGDRKSGELLELDGLGVPGSFGYAGVTANASEDFASVAEKVPACFMHLSAGFPDERGDWPLHNPKVLFNEDVLPTGAAAYAHCALQWLKNHQ